MGINYIMLKKLNYLKKLPKFEKNNCHFQYVINVQKREVLSKILLYNFIVMEFNPTSISMN